MLAMEGPRFDRHRGHDTKTLIGGTRTALGIRVVGILYRRGFAGDECVLTIVDGVRVGTGNSRVGTVAPRGG